LPNHRTAALLACALAAVLAGCGTATHIQRDSDRSTRGAAKALTIYTALPTAGPASAAARVAQQLSIENGARLALEQWHHRVRYGPGGRRGSYHIYLRQLNDADPATGDYSPSLTAANAQAAAADPTTVAYIGDYDSAATALSLQALSQSGILQLSPWSPYIGFTDANPADGTGDPERYYPANGEKTFARLVPSDLVEAQAIVSFMSSLGVTRLYVLGDVSVFDAAIAQLVANDAPGAGITLVGLKQSIDPQTNSQPQGYAQIVSDVAAERPDAVLLGASPGVGVVALWRELHTQLPHAKLFAPSTLATPAFLAAVAAPGGTCTTVSGASVSCGSAAAATYVTSPILQLRQYPAAARAVMRAYRRRFGSSASAYALYGYAAMEDVLAAIMKAGRQATDRAELLRVFFHHLGRIGASSPPGVIGSYTIDGNGDSSLRTFDGYRLTTNGALVFRTEIRVG
jgi:branched-chain amino acid transport system substrate-binding protein